MFLDRDGVVVVPEFRDGRSFAPRTLEAFHVYAGAASSVSDLKRAGFLVIIVTNQPDVGAGLVEKRIVEEMHARLRAAIAPDDIEVCYETRAQATNHRKPGDGMLRDAARTWGIDLKASFLVECLLRPERRPHRLLRRTGCAWWPWSTTIPLRLDGDAGWRPSSPDFADGDRSADTDCHRLTPRSRRYGAHAVRWAAKHPVNAGGPSQVTIA